MTSPFADEPGSCGRSASGRAWSAIFPETLHGVYLAGLPVAGVLAVLSEGGLIGRGWGIGMGLGLFLYHYLIWALHETDLERLRMGKAGSCWQRWSWLVPPVLVLAILRGDPVGWLIEQTLLETGAFVAAMGALAMWKCAREGREAPWLLAVIVFVLPAVALLVKWGAVWIARREGRMDWPDLAFGVAWVIAWTGHFQRLAPFVMGGDQLVEPLSSPRRLLLMVIWLFVLLIGGIVAGG